MDDVVLAVHAAIRTRDWPALRPLLHPYLHWTDGNHTIRGRTKVLVMLEALDEVELPSSVELRDGQIYRCHV